MIDTQFARLTAVFWKTGDESSQAATFAEYRKALRGHSERAIERAVDRAIQDGDKMPLPAHLRRLAQEADAAIRGAIHGGGGTRKVVCMSCSTAFPMWTFCPKCHPDKSHLPPNPMVIWPQSSCKTVEEWEATGHEAADWYSSRDARIGDHDPILTAPPKLLGSGSA